MAQVDQFWLREGALAKLDLQAMFLQELEDLLEQAEMRILVFVMYQDVIYENQHALAKQW